VKEYCGINGNLERLKNIMTSLVKFDAEQWLGLEKSMGLVPDSFIGS
jgi:hypothetical protein